MDSPPSNWLKVHVRSIARPSVVFATAVAAVRGAEGATTHVPNFVFETGLVPAAFVATTVNAYESPLMLGVAVQDSTLVSAQPVVFEPFTPEIV
jgi:hypothetical protein